MMLFYLCRFGRSFGHEKFLIDFRIVWQRSYIKITDSIWLKLLIYFIHKLPAVSVMSTLSSFTYLKTYSKNENTSSQEELTTGFYHHKIKIAWYVM